MTYDEIQREQEMLRNLPIVVTPVKPVAWRKMINGKWHYIDSSDPFPTQDWEPLGVIPRSS